MEHLHNTWHYPTSIRFGVDRIQELSICCQELGIEQPLLVTDHDLAKLPMVQNTLKELKRNKIKVRLFNHVKGNPTDHMVTEGVEVYKQNNHDGVVAFGGGSAIDAAKAIALMVAQEKSIWHFEDIGDNFKQANAEGIPHIIAVPTTAGTGSEVGRASVILDEKKQSKKIIFHPKMLPSIVIADPKLTVDLPLNLTAATGMDAFTHNFEAFCAPGHHPIADGIALEGMRLVKEYLPRVIKDGSDLEARGMMMAASTMGATAFQKGLGAVHALSHAIGGLYGLHHGLLNAIFLPYVVVFNEKAIASKMQYLARILNLPEYSTKAVVNWILELRRGIGIPHVLAGLDIDKKALDKIARLAAKDPTAATNPIPVGEKELRQICKNAMEGTI